MSSSRSTARATARVALRIGGAVARSAALEARASAARTRSHFSTGGPSGADLTEFDPLDPQVLADPYPWYERLHEGSAVHFNRHRGLWILHRYDDVHAALRCHEELSSAEGVTLLRDSLPTMMLLVDRPEHTRLRSPVTRYFTRQAVARYQPTIERLVDEAVGELHATQAGDAVERLAAPVPIAVISEMLGVPTADRARFRSWSERLVEIFNLAPLAPRSWRQAVSINAAGLQLHAYLHKILRDRRREPRDDLLSQLLGRADNGEISEEEVFWIALLLLVAGNETTTNLIGSLLLVLAEHPDEYAKLHDSPELVPAAIEEALRYYAPIQATYRTARCDYTVDDTTIPANARVLLLLGAANRDPRHYKSPGHFNATRSPVDHLAFGNGIHFCLGAHLARLETAAALHAVIGRAPTIGLAGTPRWRANATLRGLAYLPITLGP